MRNSSRLDYYGQRTLVLNHFFPLSRFTTLINPLFLVLFIFFQNAAAAINASIQISSLCGTPNYIIIISLEFASFLY
jgi:hypothetical protein